MLKIRVSVCRKLTDGNYGSRGAGCDLEAELDSGLLDNPDLLRARIRSAYAIAAQAVADELGQDDPEPEPRPARDRERDPSPEPRREGPPPARSNGPPPRSGGGGGSRPGSNGNGRPGGGGPPQNGRQLLGWMGRQSNREELQQAAVACCKDAGYGTRLADLDEAQTAWVYREITAKAPAGSGRWGGG